MTDDDARTRTLRLADERDEALHHEQARQDREAEKADGPPPEADLVRLTRAQVRALNLVASGLGDRYDLVAVPNSTGHVLVIAEDTAGRHAGTVLLAADGTVAQPSPRA